jgi:hypothetical protein
MDTVKYAWSNNCGTFYASEAVQVFTKHQCDSINAVPFVPESASGVLLYPNPNQGHFKVEVSGISKADNGRIEIRNTLGQSVYEAVLTMNTSGKLEAEADLQYIPVGVYYVRATIGTQHYQVVFDLVR